METPNQFTMCRDLVAGLADAGVTLFIVSPGSRNTPITLAAANDPRVDDLNIRDERSAGFMALGYAKATGRPAAVVCTSGSAAAHYLPAVVEADQSGTPLIVLTSDRPVRLRGTGAPQTMDQVDLFGNHVKTFIDAVDADGRSLAAKLNDSAIGGYPGPVHANLPFNEPLVAPEPMQPGEPSNSPDASAPPGCPPEYRDLHARHVGARILFVVGGTQRPAFPEELARVAESLGAPILGDPQSIVQGDNVIRYADLLPSAHDAGGKLIALSDLEPDLVVRLGSLPATASKPLVRWMEHSGVEQILVSDARLGDPLGSATTEVMCDPTEFLASQRIASGHADTEYLEAWKMLDRIVGEAAVQAVDTLDWPSEPEVALAVSSSVPSGSILWAASSRPIRDIDMLGGQRGDIRVLANRGVNGIDGQVSAALGAAAGSRRPTVLWCGDLTLLHDVSGLVAGRLHDADLTIVVSNDDGGGIFEYLPVAQAVPRSVFEPLFAVPHGLDLSELARGLGWNASRVAASSSFTRALSSALRGGRHVIEVPVDRAANTAFHAALSDVVRSQLRREPLR